MNMQKKIFGLLTLVLIFTFISCEEDPVIHDSQNGFIQLSTESVDVTEDSDDIISTVLLGSGTNINGVTVNFTVSSEDPSRYSVTPSTGTIEIPAGEFSADIIITPIDNFDVDGNVDVVLELSSTSSLPVGIGGEAVNFNKKYITIIDNDCPIDINAFVGTYNVSEQFTAGNFAPFGLNFYFSESYQIEISLLPGDLTGTKVVINNTSGFNTYIVDGTTMSFNTCPGTLTFDDGFPSVALFRTFFYERSSYSEDFPQVIKCEGPLSTFGEYEFVFTKV